VNCSNYGSTDDSTPPHRPLALDHPRPVSIIMTTDTTDDDDGSVKKFQWTAATIAQSIFVFLLAGVAEIMGGWLVWAAVRGDSSTTGKRPWWFAILGSVVLIICECAPCIILQYVSLANDGIRVLSNSFSLLSANLHRRICAVSSTDG